MSLGSRRRQRKDDDDVVTLESESDDDIVYTHTSQQSNHKSNGAKRTKTTKGRFENSISGLKLAEGFKFDCSAIPSTSIDLGINPCKVKEVDRWFVTHCVNKKYGTGKVLFLFGPSGSGKSTCIKTLCKQYDVDVIEWDRCFEAATDYDRKVSEWSSFETFIRQGKYSTEGGRRILFIDDLPYEAFTKTREFLSNIVPQLQTVRTPIIFALTPLDACWDYSPRRVFSPALLEESGFGEISFNASAARFIGRALNRTVKSIGIHPSNGMKEKLKVIEKACNGDIRCAMNMLNYMVTGADDPEKMSVESLIEGTRVEEFMHQLGRVMYAKRVGLAAVDNVERTLSVEKQRPPAERDVNEILDMSHVSSSTLCSNLFEHEPHFGSFSNNARSISSVAAVFDAISVCDLIVDRRSYTSRFDELTSQIAARSVMFNNFEAVKSTGLYKFNRPLGDKLNMECRKLENELISSPLWGVQMSELEYYKKLGFRFESSQRRLVSYLCRPWSWSWKTGRSHWDQGTLAKADLEKMPSQQQTTSQQKTPTQHVITVDSDSDESVVIECSTDEEEDSFDEPLQ